MADGRPPVVNLDDMDEDDAREVLNLVDFKERLKEERQHG